MTAPDDLTSTRAAIEAAERAFSGDIRCSRSGGQTCAKCNDGAECSVCYTQRHGRALLAEVRRLTDALAREEQAHSLTIDQREACHTAADSLAYAIAPVEVIGEHSNLNDPWANAEEALEVERRTHAAALATARLDGARVMHDKVRERTAALRVTIGAVAEADTRPDVDMEDEIHDLWLTVDQIEALDPAAVVGSGS